MPWFPLVFAALVIVISLHWVPPPLITAMQDTSRWCLVVAITGLGVKTSIQQLAQVGWRPIAVLLANTVDTRARMQAVMAVFVICASVLALHGIDQASTGIGWTGVELSQGTRIQYVGIFNDPNDLGMLFVMCLPMAFYQLRAPVAILPAVALGLWLARRRGVPAQDTLLKGIADPDVAAEPIMLLRPVNLNLLDMARADPI